MANAEKNLSVETLRGIAILLVVVGHVIGSGPDGGMKIDRLYSDAFVYSHCRLGLCTEAFLRIFRFWKFCPEKSIALAGADGGGGHIVFSGTVSDAGHQ